jgi:antitoxin component YwqK of YwqJK toxin-antitoxin module/plastocyanin
MKSIKHLLLSITLLFSLLIFASPSLSAAPDGDVAPFGNRDGIVNVGDALVALRFALGLETPTQDDSIHGDVAPLDINGQPDPDGQITVGDALVILRKALGLVDWDISKDTYTISTEGGSIELSDGATLTVPPNSTTIPVEVLFAETPTPPHVGEEVIATYSFATDSELLTSGFTLPVEGTGVTSADELMIVYMQRQAGPADPVDFTYDPSAHTVTFSLHNNWTFDHLRTPAKANLIHQNRDATTPQENNKDNAIVIIRNTPCPSVTGKSGPIQMPFFEQGNAGTCWANSGKILQKGLYPGNLLGAGVALEVFQFMRLLGIGLNGGIYYDSDYDKFVDLIGRGKTVSWNEYYSFSSAQKKIVEELDKGNPVIFVRLDHVVLVLGYETDIAGDIYLTQHNPQGVGAERGFYESEKWEDIATLWNWQDVIAVIWAEDTPDPNRALQSINLPGQDEPDTLYFEGKKNESGDPNIRLYLAFDHTFEDGYRWSSPPGKENSNHFPQNVNQLEFEIPVYNADLQNSAAVTFGIKVYEKDDASNEVAFSKDIVIAPKSGSTVTGDLELTPLRLNLEEESECVLHITLEKGTERTTSIPIDNFFLQPLELEISVSIPGASTNTAGNYEIVADGATYTIKAEVKDKDVNNVADGTEVRFTTTSGSLSATTATTTNGEASITLTSPTTIGSADITATVGEVSGTAKVDFIAGSITSLTVTANPATLSADGTSTSTIQIKAVDANGNPVADSNIGITAERGTLSAASATTDANGVATVAYTSPATIPQGGTDTVTATAENNTSNTISIALNYNPIVTISASPQTGSQPLQVTAVCTVSDHNWEVDHYDFYFGGNLVTSTNGTAIFTFDTDGTYDIYCEVVGKDGMTVTSESLDIAVGQAGINSYIQGLCPIPTGNNIHYVTLGEYYEKTDGIHSVKVGPEITYNQGTGLPSHLYCYVNKPIDEYDTMIISGWTYVIEELCAEYFWWENGNMHYERHYSKGEWTGAAKNWYENGTLASMTTFANGKKEGLHQEWCKNGQITINGQYVNDKKSGLWTYWPDWSCNGFRYRVETFSQGHLDGYTASFDPSTGQMLSEGYMQYIAAEDMNAKVGNWTDWRKNGSRISEGNYTYFADMGGSYEDGTWTYWFDNNNIWKTGSFKKGEKDGLWPYYYYTPDGELHSTERYSNGALLERCNYIGNIVGNEWTCTTYEQ